MPVAPAPKINTFYKSGILLRHWLIPNKSVLYPLYVLFPSLTSVLIILVLFANSPTYYIFTFISSKLFSLFLFPCPFMFFLECSQNHLLYGIVIDSPSKLFYCYDCPSTPFYFNSLAGWRGGRRP